MNGDHHPLLRAAALTALAMLAFAGNSLLCRAALRDTAIDPATFTSVRLASGAAMLWAVSSLGPARTRSGRGSWISALALFAYAAGFSFAYVGLSAGTGALLLFGAVQVTMIGVGVARGERLRPVQLLGVVLAFGGLIGLVLPGLSAPPPLQSALMLGAGVAWGVYSLRAKGAGDPTVATAGNFMRSVPMALACSLAFAATARADADGMAYAMASGAITSGLGYAVWYAALPALRAASAATVQLSVPVIAAIGGILLLGEALSLRIVLASVAVLGGVAIVIFTRSRQQA